MIGGWNPKRVVNIDEVPLREHSHGTKYAAKLGPIAALVGARRLGYRIAIVPPGKRAFPFHSHHANEEMFFILEGGGTLRYGHEELRLRKGDVVCAPAGGADSAHQIINTGDTELKYLCVSTMCEPDITE